MRRYTVSLLILIFVVSAAFADFRGQSSTLLPDGRWLLIGGIGPQGAVKTAAVRDPQTGVVTTLSSGLNHARAWHSATMLPNGKILIFGGINRVGKVEDIAELFDPATFKFTIATSTGLTPHAYQTATVLTDGRVLIVLRDARLQGRHPAEKGFCQVELSARGEASPTAFPRIRDDLSAATTFRSSSDRTASETRGQVREYLARQRHHIIA